MRRSCSEGDWGMNKDQEGLKAHLPFPCLCSQTPLLRVKSLLPMWPKTPAFCLLPLSPFLQLHWPLLFLKKLGPQGLCTCYLFCPSVLFVAVPKAGSFSSFTVWPAPLRKRNQEILCFRIPSALKFLKILCWIIMFPCLDYMFHDSGTHMEPHSLDWNSRSDVWHGDSQNLCFFLHKKGNIAEF